MCLNTFRLQVVWDLTRTMVKTFLSMRLHTRVLRFIVSYILISVHEEHI